MKCSYWGRIENGKDTEKKQHVIVTQLGCIKGKQNKYLKFSQRGEDEEGRYIGEIAWEEEYNYKTLKKMVQDREQYRKWINGKTMNRNRGS